MECAGQRDPRCSAFEADENIKHAFLKCSQYDAKIEDLMQSLRPACSKVTLRTILHANGPPAAKRKAQHRLLHFLRDTQLSERWWSTTSLLSPGNLTFVATVVASSVSTNVTTRCAVHG